ncbi:putative alcohol dehydrogenase protein [Phaeoacremonium minimum UCRPA7]|uniref:Putative alcohol dehydrogenase protein n=1 Tax=Phaeoacremonium minimum (strain UCR-PA7) TaxID=1286976 RepID=R8BVE3_PHAM7|nr:putative alcohol dehydrogenase protein [Phaeoacremonium minimum UCRPA7]EOO03269.1 putative alcohol dehydrogenase protein [Phaeoacremonium minimum UCRPA7]
MEVVMWEGKPFEMATRKVPRAKIIDKNDAVVRVTTAAICGTDLHTYHGIFGSSEVPWPMGHEAMGIVVEVGSAVESIKIGDRVVIADFPDDGHFNLEPTLLQSFTAFGLGKDFGNLGGCQAEFVRVPFADDSLINVGNSQIPDKEFLFLSDIFATAWGCLDFSGFQPGDDVTVFGAGPVGLLCAYSAIIRGASRVFSVDHIPARLEKAKSIGAIPIDFTKGEPSEQILKIVPNGTTRSCDCIGYECLNTKLKPEQNFVITQAVKVTSTGGGIGVIGVYFAEPNTKGTPRGSIISPTITFPMTAWWEKNLSMRGGGVDAKAIAPILFELVKTGRARPGFIVSGEYELKDAPEAYRRFDRKEETKVLFKFKWSREFEDLEENARQIESSSSEEVNDSDNNGFASYDEFTR